MHFQFNKLLTFMMGLSGYNSIVSWGRTIRYFCLVAVSGRWHSDCTEIKLVSPKGNQPWIFIGRTDAETEAPILWPPGVKRKRFWCWERLRARGEGATRGWGGWMTSRTQWTWFWANSGRQWRTGKPGVLQFMGSQSVGHDLVNEQQRLGELWARNPGQRSQARN